MTNAIKKNPKVGANNIPRKLSDLSGTNYLLELGKTKCLDARIRNNRYPNGSGFDHDTAIRYSEKVTVAVLFHIGELG